LWIRAVTQLQFAYVAVERLTPIKFSDEPLVQRVSGCAELSRFYVESLAHDVGESGDEHLDAGAQSPSGESENECLQEHADAQTVDVVKVGGMHTTPASGALLNRQLSRMAFTRPSASSRAIPMLP
jgi:hypothetical protein